MNEMVLAGAALIPLALMGGLFFMEYKKSQRRRAMTEQDSVEQPPEIVAEVVDQSAEVQLQPENPKIAALRNATSQSLQLNMMMLDAQKRMAEVAAMHRTDTTIRRNPQSDPNYQRTEWLIDDRNWHSDRF